MGLEALVEIQDFLMNNSLTAVLDIGGHLLTGAFLTHRYFPEAEKSKKAVSLFEGALQETLSANTTIDKGFPSDLMQTALQVSLLAKSLVIIGFDTQLNKTALQDIIDITDQGAVKLVPDVLKKLMDQKKGVQHGQTLFFPGTV